MFMYIYIYIYIYIYTYVYIYTYMKDHKGSTSSIMRPFITSPAQAAFKQRASARWVVLLAQYFR